VIAVGLLTCGGAEDGPALSAMPGIDDVQEVKGSDARCAQIRLPGVAAAIARRSARSATARGGQASRPNAAERTVVLAERSEHGPVVLGVRGERGRGPGRAARRPGRARAARV